MNLIDQLRAVAGKKDVFVHAERELAGSFGLGHEHLKTVRTLHLKRGLDWELVKGVVCYSAEGVAKCMRLLKISAAPGAVLRPTVHVDLPGGGRIATAEAVFVRGGVSAPNIVLLGGNRGGMSESVAALALKNFVSPLPGEVRTLRCLGTVRNHRVVRAEDGGREAWVRVKNSKNFRPGMELSAEFVAGDVWTFVGRLPRWPGKY